jgi:predicted RNase H-like nuclease (RuvC/YqgF family)
MCSICKEKYSDFDIPHSEASCPFRTSRYCSYCAKYGHLTKSCPARPSHSFTEPAFKEVLSGTGLKEIVSKTPIKGLPKDKPQSLLHIKDDDKIISQFLRDKGIKASRQLKENRQLLEEYAKLEGNRLIYLS